MNKAFLLIGGNIGNRKEILDKAIEEIERHAGKIINASSLYETEAWGKEQSSFLNRALIVETSFSPHKLLDELHGIESRLGRIRTGEKWQARIIDIDILFFFQNDAGNIVNMVINDEKLKLPHPYIHLRKFTLVPLAEIAPELEHPLLHKNISQLLEDCTDELKVEKWME